MFFQNFARISDNPKADERLNIYKEEDNFVGDEPISLSFYYSRQQQASTAVPNNFLLPLLEEFNNLPAMARQCTKILKLIISKVNPHQITVATADQLVYTLGKQIQWKYIEEYKDVFWMMDPLQIEMAFMNVRGNWLDGSGWVEVFEKRSDFALARVKSFLHGNKVRRCCYGHQISLAAIRKLVGDRFMMETKGQETHSLC